MAHHARIFFGLPAGVLVEFFLEMGLILSWKMMFCYQDSRVSRRYGLPDFLRVELTYV